MFTTTATGDVCNKIYLKALAADNVPIYAALPVSTIDFSINDGKIPIEERSENEVLQVSGMTLTGQIRRSTLLLRVLPPRDVTPARYVRASSQIRGLFTGMSSLSGRPSLNLGIGAGEG